MTESYALNDSNNKAHVVIQSDGSRILISYDTTVMMRHPDGTYTRTVDWISATTGKHIRLFSGLNKEKFLKLKLDKNIG